MRIMLGLAAAAALAGTLAAPASAPADARPDLLDCSYASEGSTCIRWCRIYDARDAWHPCGVENVPVVRP